MAPATCSPEPRPPRPDPSRRWIALGFEASGIVAGFALLGWWLYSMTASQMVLVVCCLLGVGVVFWHLIRSSFRT